MKFFVSYRRKDAASRGLAVALLSQLSDKNHNVFVDEHGMTIGTAWEQRIEDAIAACDSVILLVCRDIGESEYVAEEVRAAKRHAKPVMPVLVQYPEPRDEEMGEEVASVVRERQFIRWASAANTPYLVEQLAGAEPSGPPTPRRRRWWIAAVAALILLVGAFVTMRVLQIRAANALDARAARLLESESREDIDRGLVLSALAASKRGDAPKAVALAKYASLHYDRLLTTLRGPTIVGGNSLAVSPNGDAIVDGNRIWRCLPPGPLWRCREPRITPLINAGVLDRSMFASQDEIVTLNVRGLPLRWGITGEMHLITADETATATAIDGANGEIAIAFGIPPSVVVYSANGNAEPLPSEEAVSVKMLTFGPCPTCLTILDDEGDVQVWDREKGTTHRAAQNARAIAASPKGHLVVAAGDQLLFFDARLASAAVHPRIDLTTLSSMDVSNDGRQVALVHDGRVTIVNADGNEFRIVSGDAKPGVVAAQFHGDMLVTRSPTDVRVWQRDSIERKERAPLDAWPKWRDQLGLLVNGRGDFVERVFQPDH